MPPTADKTWQIPNRMDALAEMAKEILGWMEGFPLSTRARYSAVLSIEEMTTNIIKYGYDDSRKHLIRVQVAIDHAHLKIVFEDDGHPFDPTTRPPPDIENIIESRKAGGLGIELVRRMCEKMDYERAGRINRLTLRIRRLEPDDTQSLSLAELSAP